MGSERQEKPSSLEFEEVVSVAKETLLKFGSHVPTIIVEGSHGRVVTQLPEFEETYEDRVRQMVAIGFVLAQSYDIGTLKQAFMISEAWMSTGRADEPIKFPSENPERKEVLWIAGLKVPELEQSMVLMEMIRDDQGHLKRLQDIRRIEESGSKGSNLLLRAFVAGYAAASSSKLN